jgi:hypothetical protein
MRKSGGGAPRGNNNAAGPHKTVGTYNSKTFKNTPHKGVGGVLGRAIGLKQYANPADNAAQLKIHTAMLKRYHASGSTGKMTVTDREMKKLRELNARAVSW